MDENDIIVRNKARLVAQGFNQEEWIDYEGMLLTFAFFKHFVLYQIDLKSVFLNGFINEEV